MPRQKSDKKAIAFYLYPTVSDDIDKILSKTEKSAKVTRSAVVTAAIALTNELMNSGSKEEQAAVIDLLMTVDGGV